MDQHDPAPRRRLDGKVVAVVIGATQGLGEAIARRVAAADLAGLASRRNDQTVTGVSDTPLPVPA